jgi:hypothetical protein
LLAELKRLQQAALQSDYALKETAHLTNKIGPRLSGSVQAQHAIEYVAEEMRKLGLEVELQKLMVPQWIRGIEAGGLTQFVGMAPGTRQKIVLTAIGGSLATPPEGLAAPIVVVSNFDELSRLGESKIRGRIVLFNAKFDEQLQAQGDGLEAYSQVVKYRTEGAVSAARLGAVAALNRSTGSGTSRLPHTGSIHYADGIERIPAAAVTAEDADLIARLATEGEVKIHLTLTPQTLPDIESFNVIGDVKGSESPDQVIIVSGHLDSWDLGTGALDDAAGVAMAMQVANLCRQLNLKPKRTIRVIAWMNEENGARGAKTYFHSQSQSGRVANHIAAIESDLGAGHPTGFYAHVALNALRMLQPIGSILQSSGAGSIRPVNESGGVDIAPLEKAGIPGFVPQDSRTYFNHHHTAADTFDKINPAELAENAAVMAVLAYAIANMPDTLPKSQPNH